MSTGISNLSTYEKDLDNLIKKGNKLCLGFLKTFVVTDLETPNAEFSDEDIKEIKAKYAKIPAFDKTAYESWYSESIYVIKLLLPDRLSDFLSCYGKPRNRKELSLENYTISDALNGLTRKGINLKQSCAYALLQRQNDILASVKKRFKSSLFDIRQIVQADIFDSELDSSRELLKNKFFRAAGAIAGVVLEKHLVQVCNNHSINIAKKDPSISFLNDLLKDKDILDLPTWRNIQYLGDLRNLCDHDKKTEPTESQIEELITGIDKITKTIF